MRNNKHEASVLDKDPNTAPNEHKRYPSTGVSKLKMPSPRLSITKFVPEPDGDSPEIRQ